MIKREKTLGPNLLSLLFLIEIFAFQSAQAAQINI